jgi:lipoprotein-releasing system ATP-binding protein
VVDNVLELRDIRKSYLAGGSVRTEILHGISLDLRRGEFCALMGPSGSGKSTLLNVIGLLDRADSGLLRIDHHDTAELSDKALTALRGHSIGFVFQYHHLISAFTTKENVMMPLLVQRGFANKAIRERAFELLEKVGLAPWSDSLATKISGGQQQRVAIARALAANPALVLADEPTGNLDSKSADLVFDIMRDINKTQGTSFLIVTHNQELAERCDRILEVVDGYLVS